jgi:hypothetical protein
MFALVGNGPVIFCRQWLAQEAQERARTALLEGTKAGAAGSISKASGVGVKDRQGLSQRTAVFRPVRTVVWKGRSREAPPYLDFRSEQDAPASLSSSATVCQPSIAFTQDPIVG